MYWAGVAAFVMTGLQVAANIVETAPAVRASPW